MLFYLRVVLLHVVLKFTFPLATRYSIYLQSCTKYFETDLENREMLDFPEQLDIAYIYNLARNTLRLV